MKSILLIMQHSAFASAKAREAQDLLMALCATEHQVSVLYTNAGVTQLKPTASDGASLKDFTKAQKLFPLYDVVEVFACSQSLECYQLTEDMLTMPVRIVSIQEQQSLLPSFDEVILC